MRLFVLLIVLLALPLAGCGSDDDGAAAALRGPVTLKVSGGFAGLTESVVVEPDGEAVISRGRSTESAVIPEDDLAGLAADLDSSGLFDEDREYRGTGADLQTYTITYDGVSVVADETEIPETLASVIARLEALRP